MKRLFNRYVIYVIYVVGQLKFLVGSTEPTLFALVCLSVSLTSLVTAANAPRLGERASKSPHPD